MHSHEYNHVILYLRCSSTGPGSLSGSMQYLGSPSGSSSVDADLVAPKICWNHLPTWVLWS